MNYTVIKVIKGITEIKEYYGYLEKAEMKMEELGVEERREKIIELVTQKTKVKVLELSKMFGISEVTIRNDLSELENKGFLERTHGGAISTNKSYYNMSLKDRAITNTEEKRKIAAAAAAMISDGDTVMMNSGTTTLFTVRELAHVKNLMIVTNSVSIAQEVSLYNNMKVILLGGYFDAQYQFTYGDDTIHQLNRYKADKLILAVDGFSPESGVTTYHHLEVEVNKQMMARVNKKIVVADYSKIGRTSFVYIDQIESIDTLITDQKANAEEVQEIINHNVEVKLV
ncbi:DeoR/GlpR family DNA-binding transcription regulator [Paenibacillus eucommiae]|uniref:DeoR/GlpR family transcriptional regulator of sugar metabolism n=1 Tax=Paenibacillus eucommiae TaxID=1355755 RepID=A0ABS4ITI2_9BACL|nr:DeoR/GlpR family DNA-binding transcription regulator [Paenibacillus eucommiae]MBP1990331.1 DeoR/GlpR family transcriptional regulator of sugar metabolism [Paenibacillus eucommiae]